MYNRQTASVRIPFGYELRVYRQDGQIGSVEGTDYLAMHGFAYEDENQEHICQNMPAGWVDVDASFSVQKVSQAGKGAVGSWETVNTQSESFYRDITVEFTQTETDETTKEEQFAFSRDQESSISYEFATAETKMSMSYSADIREDNKSTQSYSTSINYRITCTTPDGQPNVGLYQWVTSSSTGNVKVKSMHTVCRYGANYNSPPACPWNACKDAECTQCTEDWMA